MRQLLRVLVVLGMGLVLLATPSVATAQEAVNVTIGKKATLLESGQAVQVEVAVACPPGGVVLEAFVYVTQDGNQSAFAGIPVVCDGTAHTFAVRVPALDFQFHKGKGGASAFLLLESGESTSPARTIKIGA